MSASHPQHQETSAITAFSSLSACLSVSVSTRVWAGEGVEGGWLNVPLLVIALQRLRGESRMCSKRRTFNRRQSATSELCNHHIIHYEPAVLFLPVLVVMVGVSFTVCLFWVLPNAETNLLLQPERAFEHLSVTCFCSGSEGKTSIVFCVCWCVFVWVCACVFFHCARAMCASESNQPCVERVFLQHISFHMEKLSVNSNC